MLIDNALLVDLQGSSCHVAVVSSTSRTSPSPTIVVNQLQAAARGALRAQQPTTATMLLLDYQNVLIQSVLTERFSG